MCICQGTHKVTRPTTVAELRREQSDYTGGDTDEYRRLVLDADVEADLKRLALGNGWYRCPRCSRAADSGERPPSLGTVLLVWLPGADVFSRDLPARRLVDQVVAAVVNLDDVDRRVG